MGSKCGPNMLSAAFYTLLASSSFITNKMLWRCSEDIVVLSDNTTFFELNHISAR